MSATPETAPAPRRKRRGSPLPLLLGLLVCFGGAALVLTDPFGWRTPDEAALDAADPGRRVLVDLKTEEISAVEIDPPADEPFKLVKDGEAWAVEQGGKQYAADGERVETLLSDLAGLRSDSIATEQPGELETFEVDEAKAIVVRVFSGGDAPVSTLHVGKAAPGFSAAFVRVDEGSQVYRAGKNLRTAAALSFRDYRNRRPWTFKPEEASALTVRPMSPEGAQQAALTFSKVDGVWQHNGANANQNAITELLKKLSDLDTTQFADDATPEQTKLAGAQPALEVTTPAGQLSLTLGAKVENDWYVADQEGIVYQFGDYKLTFYRELDTAGLTFDDTAKAEPEGEGEEAAASATP